MGPSTSTPRFTSDVESDDDVFVDMTEGAIQHFRETSNPPPAFFSEEEKKVWCETVIGSENFNIKPALKQALQLQPRKSALVTKKGRLRG
jgi:hypothetical protein